MPEGWEWDESLYRGSATYYNGGRMAYAAGLADALAERLLLDGRGRLIDIGCGPGSIALLLAHLFAEVIGVDPDSGMLVEAERLATVAGIGNVRWVQARAEELASDLGTFRVAAFGQSFHWMDRALVASIVFGLLEPGGAFVHINETKDYLQSLNVEQSTYPAPPYKRIADLVSRVLGPVRLAGAGTLPFGTPDREDVVLIDAGFIASESFVVPGDGPITRSINDVVAWVYSRSNSAPHLFVNKLHVFDSQLRDLLLQASPTGLFEEYRPATEVKIFRKP